MTRASSRCRTAARSGAAGHYFGDADGADQETVTMLTAGKRPKQLNQLLTDND